MSTGASCIVEQFGFAMIPSWPARSSGLTWLTTSGMAGSIRQADELSMTVAPRAAAWGARAREMSAPALKSAMSTPSKASGTASWISISRPSTRTTRPADRPEARSRSSPIGNARSPSTAIMVLPTAPVAPTTATVRDVGWVIRGGLRAWLRRDFGSSGHGPEYSNGPHGTRSVGVPSAVVEWLAGTTPAGGRIRPGWVAALNQKTPAMPGPSLCFGSVGARRAPRGLRLDGLLGEVALHGRLAGEVDPALAIDLDHDHHHLVADGHDVLDGGHVVVGELADADEAFLARQDLDEGAEAHDPGDLAQVEGTDLDLAGEALDPLDRLARVLARDRGDFDGAVVLDVDLGGGLFLDLADHRSTLADDLADLLGVDLDRDDARCEVAHLGPNLGEDLGHLVEDRETGGEGLLEAVTDDRLADALDLDVHLQGGDAVPRSGHLEVHVTDRVLLAEDVGQDDERPVGLGDEAHRRTGDRCQDRHAGVHEGEGGTAGRGHRRGPVRGHALADEADHVGELVVRRQDRQQGALGQVAVPDVAPAGPAHHLDLARAVRGEVVVVDVALLGLGADRVDPLDVR